jgi:SAM-dependent methyltransferase
MFRVVSNGYGVALRQPSRQMQRWIELASPKNTLPMLEIGAADGVATLAALRRGAAIIANDLNVEFLNELKGAAAAATPEAASERQAGRPGWGTLADGLTLLPGSFQASLTQLPRGSVGHVLSANVFHFLSPDMMREGLRELHRVMQPGAKLLLEADSPLARTPLRHIYHLRRWLGATHPGLFLFGARQDAGDTEALPLPRRFLPERLSAVRHYHMLDPDILGRYLEDAGFRIERCELTPTMPGDMLNLTLDGREVAEAVAVR